MEFITYEIALFSVPACVFGWVIWEQIKMYRERKRQEFKLRLKYGEEYDSKVVTMYS